MRLWTRPEAWPYLERVEVRSVIVAPVRATSRVLGMLLLWRERCGPAFTETDRVFAEEVTRRLAPAFAAAEEMVLPPLSALVYAYAR
jgi:GAF domain-containing protein